MSRGMALGQHCKMWPSFLFPLSFWGDDLFKSPGRKEKQQREILCCVKTLCFYFFIFTVRATINAVHFIYIRLVHPLLHSLNCESLQVLSEWVFSIFNTEKWVHASKDRYITLSPEAKVHYRLYFLPITAASTLDLDIRKYSFSLSDSDFASLSVI